MKKSLTYSLCVFGLSAFMACNADNSAAQQRAKEPALKRKETVISYPSAPEGGSLQYVAPPAVPAEVSFAGQNIPLQREDVYEALEYELTVNMFRHSRTLTILRNVERWRPLIEQTLKENGIPLDFLYLAVAESEFDNSAQSHVGAMGMWQFMESTGKEYGLHIDKDADMRRDPKLATEAACRYLNKAYAQLKDWALVAASYNRGISGIQNVMRDQQASSFFDLHLNPETERYVYRILAFKLILENPQAYGYYVESGTHYKPYSFTTIAAKEGEILNLVQLAQKYKTTYKELRKLNPWFNNTNNYSLTVAKNQVYHIRIPAATASGLEQQVTINSEGN